MKQKMKMAFLFFLASIPAIATFAYLSFNGNPILKHSIGLKGKVYAEKKYGMELKITQTHYNYKSKSYEATMQPLDSVSPTFMVYKRVQLGGNEAFLDTYPEAIWGKEIQAIIQPTIKKLFPDASKIKIFVPMGSKYSLPAGQIPSYKSMEAVPYEIELTIEEDYKQDDNGRILTIVNLLKKEQLTFVGFHIKYNDQSFFAFTEDLNIIKNEDDINRFIAIN